jgi:lipopolysaccharide export system protein LptA
MYIGEDDVIQRARFGGGVTWDGQEGATMPGGTTMPVSGDWWRLKCRRLDLRFAEDRSIDEAVASPEGQLTLAPEPGSTAVRHLVSDTLSFKFDDEGRMEALVGLGGRAGVRFETLPEDDEPPRTLTAERFNARFDPATGRLRGVDFYTDVEFVEGNRRGRADQARWDAVQQRMVLSKQPQVEDLDEGSQLFAEVIRIEAESRDIHARDGVRHVVRGRVGPLGADEGPPTVVSCRTFDYTDASESALYEGAAVLRAGADEVSAASIRIEPESGDAQRLTATGDVVALLRAGGGDPGGADGLVSARAQRMVYSGAAGEIRYAGGVTIRQGQLETRSPTATLSLEGDPPELTKLVAGEPVEVRHADRLAEGRRATYAPGDRTMVIEGEDAVMTDPEQRVQGRKLTFRLGDDDVIIEGRDVRTEMVIKQIQP